ncbi:hypothetical protein [Raineyella sp. LH-20]|uniref:glycosyltransferase family 2 protein n=1 Tax=Raineyella sp. LH-20 TaxID=3081204 RepID=UPI002953D134|nr:hypothetical protein [Raineyella sp. LH-20]WOP20095.1 hypothetical protein R0146_07415 [Raineyella sp. LH-20]
MSSRTPVDDLGRLAFVITTLGRIAPLGRLLDGLVPQLTAGDQVVIVAQDHVDEVRRLVADRQPVADRQSGGDSVAGDPTSTEGRPADAAPRIVVVTSGRGAARGRNVGVEHVVGDPVLQFPNDTSEAPEGFAAALRGLAPHLGVGAITFRDEHGPKFVLPAPGTPLDRWNVWSVMEVGVLVRRSVFLAAGGFDPEIGSGAATPWQAGEVTDFLLRAMDRGLTGDFVWAPSDVAIAGVGEATGLSPAEHRRKVRAYSRGTSRVLGRWSYPLWWRLAFVAAGLVIGVRHDATHRPVDGWWAFVGRLEGLLGRVLGPRDGRAMTAVRR